MTNQKTRKRYKKGSNSDKANQKKKDVFSFYFIVGLNFLLKKTCVCSVEFSFVGTLRDEDPEMQCIFLSL